MNEKIEQVEASVTVNVTVSREDGSYQDWSETFPGREYLTEDQFRRVVDGVGAAVLTPVPDEGEAAPVDTSRMMGGVA